MNKRMISLMLLFLSIFSCSFVTLGKKNDANDAKKARQSIYARFNTIAKVTKYASGGIGAISGLNACKNAAEGVWAVVKMPCKPSSVLKVPCKVWGTVTNSFVAVNCCFLCYILHKLGY